MTARDVGKAHEIVASVSFANTLGDGVSQGEQAMLGKRAK